jgi:hypothetical protein
LRTPYALPRYRLDRQVFHKSGQRGAHFLPLKLSLGLYDMLDMMEYGSD